MPDYDEILQRNVQAYEGVVAERASGDAATWKLEEHDGFASKLVDARCRSVVEIGAGTGFHSRRFADAGFDVLATDPTPAMVAYCRSSGLDAMQADVLGLALEQPRDAAFAMNSLLHVPRALLRSALERVAGALRAKGLFYLGVYGGNAHEGVMEQDSYVPKRWFASHTDEELMDAASSVFDVLDFHVTDLGRHELHFQSLTLRAP